MSPNARAEVCQAAREVTGAAFAILLEPAADGRLASTAATGVEMQPFGVRPGSAPDRVMATRRPLFLADADGHPAINATLWREHGGPASMLFQPVLRGDDVAGVLILGWSERFAAAPAADLIALLAAETAIALERADLVQGLNDLALSDPLTGVLNRRGWDLTLDAALSGPHTVESAPCAALLDLDHFKAFNDARGHQCGDRLLKETVAAWRAVLRPGDVLARYGGEEFAVLLPDCTEAAALAVIERLRDSIPYAQTCSAGIARWDGRESADDLLRRADVALYAAKAAGRDRAFAAG
jgi:diguanylate cyclase (GGDEF)-like protein